MTYPPAVPSSPEPMFRSGAVARMAGMPVATLRIWEQRYRAVAPVATPSGHRLYSSADVERVLLLRQLTGQGHAIGSIAALDATQLSSLAGREPPAAQLRRTPSRSALRVAIVGPALATRMARPAVRRQCPVEIESTAVFASLAEVARSRAAKDADVLLWHAPALRPESAADLEAVQRGRGLRKAAVIYRFASAAAIQSLKASGVLVIREPADDEALGSWLAALEAALPRASSRPAGGVPVNRPGVSQTTVRRFDDETLTAFAGRPAGMACECPRHVAELLMQLSSFESYSAGCVHRSPEDADLHAYLQQVAGAARAMFETALERVARHEGLPLR